MEQVPKAAGLPIIDTNDDTHPAPSGRRTGRGPCGQVLATLIGLLALAAPAYAQGAMTNGENHTGIIALPAEFDTWTFSAIAGELITLTVAEVGADSPMVPFVRLISPSGTLVAQSWGALAAGVTATAVTGAYTVQVMSNDTGADATGDYVLRLAKAPSAFVVPMGDDGGTLINGGNHTGVIDRGDVDSWSFAANVGDHIVVKMAEVGADTSFVPFLRLIGPTGAIAAQSWGSLAAGVTISAVTGTYTLQVMSNDTGREATGRYVVRLAKAPGAFTVPADDEGGPLTSTNRSGVIDRGDVDQWSCRATAGVLTTFAISETGGDTALVPFMRLIGPTGTTVAQTWGAQGATMTVNIPTTGEYRLLIMSNDTGGEAEGSYVLTIPTCHEPVVPSTARRDIAVDFGQYGLWMRYNHGTSSERWQQIDARDPQVMATGDIDGDGHDDLIVTFRGAGVHVWMNDAEWVQLHPLDATDVATGDLDADGRDDVILSFPGFGLYVRYNNATWTRLHPLASAGLVMGDMDGDDRADAVVNFPGFGVWRYANNSTWVRLHPFQVTAMTMGDLNGDRRDDLVLNFQEYGVWVCDIENNWTRLHSLSASTMAIGNLDGDTEGRQDVTLTFAGVGVRSWMNNTSWVNRHPLEARPLTTGDLDGSGRDDLLLGFGGHGLWVLMNNASFAKVHSVVPDDLVTGRFDDN